MWLEIHPLGFHGILEGGEFGNLANPVLVEIRALVDIFVAASPERVPEVPHRAENHLSVGTALLVPVAAAVKRLSIVGNLLCDIEFHEFVNVDIVLPFGR